MWLPNIFSANHPKIPYYNSPLIHQNLVHKLNGQTQHNGPKINVVFRFLQRLTSGSKLPLLSYLLFLFWLGYRIYFSHDNTLGCMLSSKNLKRYRNLVIFIFILKKMLVWDEFKWKNIIIQKSYNRR